VKRVPSGVRVWLLSYTKATILDLECEDLFTNSDANKLHLFEMKPPFGK
jgi:hypothetical protein